MATLTIINTAINILGNVGNTIWSEDIIITYHYNMQVTINLKLINETLKPDIYRPEIGSRINVVF